ncbi:unnamed protein product [Euphydryas editha]|uniref:FP protein C-terminal domain-containing protein n=1 Tax=Euphydryas editha TaxID=104508 RepID=A0AAU9UT20_EUPED|nr:unnamed protein product [Euphydryas editha]
MDCAGCTKKCDSKGINCTHPSCKKSFCSICINTSNMTADRRRVWRCPDCSALLKRGDNSNTPIRNSSEPQNVTFRKKQELPSSNNCNLELQELTSEIRLLREEFTSLKSRLEDVTLSLERCHVRLGELGVSVTKTRKVGVELEDRDIDSISRVGPRIFSTSSSQVKAKLLRPVVVRLLRRLTRDQILKAAKSRRNITSTDLEIPGNPLKVYFNERLTRENRISFREARIKAKEKGYAYCWTSQGSLFVRQSEGKAAIPIRSREDLNRIYRSPSYNPENFISSLDTVLHECSNNIPLLIAGDMNINILHSSDNVKATEYLSLTRDHGLAPAISVPTRNDNCIDHIFVRSNNEAVGIVCSSNVTDHDLVLVGLTFNKKKIKKINRLIIKRNVEAIRNEIK